jgi:predicted Rdx family selenoprotein
MKQLYLVHTAPEFLSQAVREMKIGDADPAKLAQAVRELVAAIPWGHHANLLAKLPAEFKGRLPTAKQLADAVRDVITPEK